MGFYIKIGQTSDNTYKVGKSVSWKTTGSGVLISPLSTIDQLSPVFVIDYNALYLNCNYVEASFLSRKYYCSVSVDTAGRMVLKCSVDYLDSFDLSNCRITVTRNGGIGAPTEIPDSKFPVIPNRKDMDSRTVFNDAIGKFENDVRAKNYLVITVGGGS